MTLVLGIDTSTQIASVAIVRDDLVLALTHQATRGSDLANEEHGNPVGERAQHERDRRKILGERSVLRNDFGEESRRDQQEQRSAPRLPAHRDQSSRVSSVR